MVKTDRLVHFRRWLGPSFWLAVALTLGRITGLLREVTVASKFGISMEADIAVLLLALPDVMVGLLVAGGISAAFVPQLNARDADEGKVLIRFTAIVIAGIFGLIGLLFAISPQAIFLLLAPGNRELADAVPQGLALLIGLSLPIAALTGVLGGYHNANGRFFVVGAGTLVFNIAIIAILLGSTGLLQPMTALAFGILGGVTARLLLQLKGVPADVIGRKILPSDWKRYLGDFSAGLLATGIGILAPVAVRAWASFFGPGSVATVNYAQKLVELPTGVLFGALCTVALSEMSKANARNDHADATMLFAKYVRIVVLLGCVATVVCMGLSRQISEIVFSYGAINESDISKVSDFFFIAAISIPLTGISLIFISYYMALKLSRQVLVLSLISFPALMLACFTFYYVDSFVLLPFALVVHQIVLVSILYFRSEIDLKSIISGDFAKLLLYAVSPLIAAAAMGRYLEGIGLVFSLGGFGAAMLVSAVIVSRLWPRGFGDLDRATSRMSLRNDGQSR